MKKILYYIKVIGKDKELKKGYFRILFELLYCLVIYREFPHFYIHKMLYRKNIGNYLNYISHGEWLTLIRSKYLHNPSYTDIFKNKILFDKVFSEAKIPIPKTLAYKIGNYIYINSSSQGFYFTDSQSLEKIIIEELLNNQQRIFVKTADTMGGANCYLLELDNISGLSNIIYSFSTSLFQEIIEQHSLISQIHPLSINTIRFDVFKDDNNQVNFLNALLRVGVGASIVDNASSGGFFIKIDTNTGKLNSVGRQFLRYGGNIYYKHPDTDFEFAGLEIPYFEEAKELITKGMATVNEKLVGWDVAITPSGPIIMEGNHSLSLFMSDMAIEGYKKNEVMQKILKRIN